jgi:hypothetical protein
MPIRSFLASNHSFGPEEIAKMSAAFEAASAKLGLVKEKTRPAEAERVFVKGWSYLK